MKTVLSLFLLNVVLIGNAPGQTPGAYRFDVEAGVSALNLPAPYRTGWHLRQQVTGYFLPRLGVSFGLGRGLSSNNDPLQTLTTTSNQPDPAQLRAFYNRQDNMTDLSVVFLPILSKQYRVKIQVGRSSYRQRELRVDSIFRDYPGSPIYRTSGQLTDIRRKVLMTSIGYDFWASNRWAVGINGTAYFAPEGITTTLGLRTTYRFNLLSDSLGTGPIRWQDLHAGVRLGAGFVGENGPTVSSNYRPHIVGGVWAELPLSLTWTLRGELNYTQRGYRRGEIDLGSTRYPAAYANLGYLEIPLLFRNELAYRWHLYVGPYVAVFLHGYTETGGIRNPPISPNSLAGVMLGTSYDLTKRLFADLRVQRDLVQLSSTPYNGFHGYQLSLGWAFR